MAMNASCLTFVTNADYASLFAMEIEKLLANDKITTLCERNNVSETFFKKLQTTKLFGLQVFKSQNCNLLQSCSSLSICSPFCFRCVIYTLF